MRSWSSVPVPALPGRGPELRLYDSADRQVRPVASGTTATMYVCGITPYDATHLGHAATYLAFDLVHRVWRDAGHRVHYVQNITDVDEPLFERAHRDGEDWRELADREIELFREDMAALRVLPPSEYIAATEAIAEVVELVEKMLASGAAYSVDDPDHPDVYFRVDATSQFGYESGYDRETMARLFAERGGDPDRPGKARRARRAAVAAPRQGEPSWPSPLGPGPPGLARRMCGDRAQPARHRPRYPGRRIGPDLPAPRVLRRARRMLTGEQRFARHYVHAGMIGWTGRRCTSAAATSCSCQAARRRRRTEAIRLALLAGHYRADRRGELEVLPGTGPAGALAPAAALPAGPDATDVWPAYAVV